MIVQGSLGWSLTQVLLHAPPLDYPSPDIQEQSECQLYLDRDLRLTITVILLAVTAFAMTSEVPIWPCTIYLVAEYSLLYR